MAGVDAESSERKKKFIFCLPNHLNGDEDDFTSFVLTNIIWLSCFHNMQMHHFRAKIIFFSYSTFFSIPLFDVRAVMSETVLPLRSAASRASGPTSGRASRRPSAGRRPGRPRRKTKK